MPLCHKWSGRDELLRRRAAGSYNQQVEVSTIEVCEHLLSLLWWKNNLVNADGGTR